MRVFNLAARVAAFLLCLPMALPAEPLKLLRTEGTRLTADGKTVQLKGPNLGGWLLQETWMSPVKGSEDHWTTLDTLNRRFGAEKAAELIAVYEDHWITGWDLDAIRDLGFNVVRVPFGYWNLQDDQGNWRRTPAGAIDFGRLDWIVNESAARGIWVILDLHGAPGFASKEHSSGKVGATQLFEPGARGEAFRLKTIDLWTEVARHFAGNPGVAAYDLLNEPMAKPDDQTLWNLYDRLYQAIRRVDPDHLISVEAIWEVNNLPDPKVYGWHNMLYQTHDYGWDTNQVKFIEGKIASAELLTAYDVPLLVGEFNAFAQYSDWDNTLAQYDKAGFSWTMWTWKIAKKGTSSWGIWSSPYIPSPNIKEDDFEAIRDAWSRSDTSGSDFNRNDYLVQALKKSLARPPQARPVAKKTSVSRGTRYEAEAFPIVLSTHKRAGIPAGTEAQGFFSGKLAAGGLNSGLTQRQVANDWSNLPHVEFTVNAGATGPHKLVLAYNGDDDKTILVKVNGATDLRVDLPQLSGGAWNVMHQKELTVNLVAGDNTVWISGTLGGQGWENVDYLEVSPLP